ncbi:NAD(P)-dependent dehydrogenase, short-chain alcohol dehydrogenase family [Shimia gijangensis]|uniref:NAD(P)-dependent dehydrogenase, short-chain alcohol dehydrogenase family n=1 Tax=Shimia gijangensis TaxID=1470563 RepID=A0A1M6T752_9RHOB|nr:glucose 1-dehydrogenase [Shimia gijangensis]SHK52817.1 NAD(P)-dependent dehydrogenase, short-chain alcohol dehydrogenase family [Shimia gijangensis]
MTKPFTGQVALVTGASSGIGRATAQAFAKGGAKVVVAARRPEQCEETVDLIRSAGGEAIFCKTDVAKPAEVKTMIETTIAGFGALNFLFNNAGVEGTTFTPIEDYAEDDWAQVIAINLTGVFLCTKYAMPHLVRTKGAIVNMASIAGLSGGRMGAAYYASKHGVVGLTKSTAIEYADKGVRVNAVAPAVIKTPMIERADLVGNDEIEQKMLSLHPLGRFGVPEEVANAVTWLCSEQASFVTGHTLPVDGGFLVP